MSFFLSKQKPVIATLRLKVLIEGDKEAPSASWTEGASLALVEHLSGDGNIIKIPYRVDVLFSFPIQGSN